MRDEDKTKEELIKELNELRQKVSGFPIYKSDEKLELFNALLNQSNDAIFIIEPESGRFLDVNNKACSNLRYLRDELLDIGVSDAEKAILRAKYLTKQLLTFSKGGEPIKKTLSLGEVIKEVAVKPYQVTKLSHIVYGVITNKI